MARYRQTVIGADNSVRPFWKIPCLRARVTFGRCSKSDQKNSQKPRFLDFLHAVLITNLRPCTTRSQNMAVFVAYDVSPVLPAPLPLTLSTVEPKTLFGVSISGSGAGAETIPLTETKKEILRERVAGSYNAVCTIARKEVKKPLVSSGSFAHFSSWREKWAAGGTFPSKSPAGANKDKEHPRPLKAITIEIACHFPAIDPHAPSPAWERQWVCCRVNSLYSP